MTLQEKVEIAVIGAGLSGLATALLLTERGRTVRVIEARGAPGGRIRSVFDVANGQYVADLGPTWIWPAFQPLIAHWVDKLQLETFPQYDTGKAILDYGPDTEPQIRFLPGQDGNVRVVGGPQAMVDRLVERLPEDTVQSSSPVTEISVTGDGVELQIDSADSSALTCKHLVVAVPPRIAVNALRWHPALPAELSEAMNMVPTWMAPHAKVVAVYDEHFWRKENLSGRIASQAGPIVEGHDHCGSTGSPATVFGFIGWPHDVRAKAGSALRDLVHAQLLRCFGTGCPAPKSIHIEEWASDPLVASPRDLVGPILHPTVGHEIIRQIHGDGRLWFAGAETATRSPGLIEGAFDAAERVSAGIG